MTGYGSLLLFLAAGIAGCALVTVFELHRGRRAERDEVTSLWGLWATFLGALSSRAAAASNRAWSRVDRQDSRHRWGRDDQAAVEVGIKVLEHRRLSRAVTR